MRVAFGAEISGKFLETGNAAEFGDPEQRDREPLTINITGEQAREIEAEAAPIRESVTQMFAKYRPALGNGEGKVRDVEAVVEQQPSHSASHSTEQTVITHRDGDEKRESFWKMLVSSDQQTPVARETAIRVLLVQTIGYKAHSTKIAFSDNPITVEELFAKLEKLCGATGWQAAQNLAVILQAREPVFLGELDASNREQ
jgi:hypothetical protein